MFLSLTEGQEEPKRKRLVITSSAAVVGICLVLFFAGTRLFELFGITLDSFRIGSGVLLMLSGIGLVRGESSFKNSGEGDIAVVPLAIPIIVGPATTGTLLVMGAEMTSLSEKSIGCAALTTAVTSLAIILFCSSMIQRLIGIRGISILSKLTGLALVALSAQMIMTGIQGFLHITP